MQKLGHKIKVLIKARGWQMKDFAIEVGYDPSAFSRMLKSISPESKKFALIAKKLDVSANWICIQEKIGPGNMPPRGEQLPRSVDEMSKDEIIRENIRLAEENERMKADLSREREVSDDLRAMLKVKTIQKQ